MGLPSSFNDPRQVDAAERDRVIAAAVAAGKFSAERAAHWREQWDANPVATRATIAQLAAVGSPAVERAARGRLASSMGLSPAA